MVPPQCRVVASVAARIVVAALVVTTAIGFGIAQQSVTNAGFPTTAIVQLPDEVGAFDVADDGTFLIVAAGQSLYEVRIPNPPRLVAALNEAPTQVEALLAGHALIASTELVEVREISSGAVLWRRMLAPPLHDGCIEPRPAEPRIHASQDGSIVGIVSTGWYGSCAEEMTSRGAHADSGAVNYSVLEIVSANGDSIARETVVGGPALVAAVSRDGTRAAILMDTKIRVLDAGGTLKLDIRTPFSADRLSISDNGDAIAARSDTMVGLFDGNTGVTRWVRPTITPGALALDASGAKVAFSEALNVTIVNESGTVTATTEFRTTIVDRLEYGAGGFLLHAWGPSSRFAIENDGYGIWRLPRDAEIDYHSERLAALAIRGSPTLAIADLHALPEVAPRAESLRVEPNWVGGWNVTFTVDNMGPVPVNLSQYSFVLADGEDRPGLNIGGQRTDIHVPPGGSVNVSTPIAIVRSLRVEEPYLREDVPYYYHWFTPGQHELLIGVQAHNVSFERNASNNRAWQAFVVPSGAPSSECTRARERPDAPMRSNNISITLAADYYNVGIGPEIPDGTYPDTSPVTIYVQIDSDSERREEFDLHLCVNDEVLDRLGVVLDPYGAKGYQFTYRPPMHGEYAIRVARDGQFDPDNLTIEAHARFPREPEPPRSLLGIILIGGVSGATTLAGGSWLVVRSRRQSKLRRAYAKYGLEYSPRLVRGHPFPRHEGSTSAVFSAEGRAGIQIAIKRLRYPENPEHRAELISEIQRFERLPKHRNIVRYAGTNGSKTKPILYLEYLEGYETMVPSEMDPEAGVAAVLGLVVGLAHMHSHDMPHGDVSPWNTLWSGSHAVIIDIGGRKHGTHLYTAPERLRGAPASPATDMYSIGVILLEIASRIPLTPMLGQDQIEMVSQPRLRALIEDLLSQSPDARPTAWAVSAILREIRDEGDSSLKHERRRPELDDVS